MADEEKRIWGIHTKDDNMFLQKSLIAIGWKDMGDLSKIEASREAFKEHYTQVYPDAKKGSVANGAGMLYRFAHEVQVGDYGLFVSLSNYTKNARKYLDNTPIIRAINGTELVDLILKYYEDLSEKYRIMIPLKRVYIPVTKEDAE